MIFLEKDLERIIKETPNALLKERGLKIDGFKRTQVKIGNYGIADLITAKLALYQGEIRHIITVYELKQDVINIFTFLQAIGYVKGIYDYLLNVREIDPIIKIVLIGKKVKDDNFIYLPDTIPNISLYTYEYNFNGIKFKQHSDYSLIEKGF